MDTPKPPTPHPRCDKCEAVMAQVAVMPAMNFSGVFSRVYQCEPCERTKWVDK
jgi:uncharacterized protein with PIN domain